VTFSIAAGFGCTVVAANGNTLNNGGNPTCIANTGTGSSLSLTPGSGAFREWAGTAGSPGTGSAFASVLISC
jgi:hypothetical protein